jgi:hypothetical protein
MQIGHISLRKKVGQSNTGKQGSVRNVSGVANTVNITPGGGVVKSGFEIGAQGRQSAKTLGMIEIDDQQTDTGMDDGIPGETVPFQVRRFKSAGTFKEIMKPGVHDLFVREEATELVHAPDDSASPRKTQITVLVTAKQKKNGRAPRRKNNQVCPSRRQGGVHGQDAGMSQKEPVEDGRPPVFMPADPAPHAIMEPGEIIQALDLPLARHGVGIAKHGPRPGMRQKQMLRRDATL